MSYKLASAFLHGINTNRTTSLQRQTQECVRAVQTPFCFSTMGSLGSSVYCSEPHKQKKNSVSLSLQANYTDWATATCRRNFLSTFVGRAVSRGQRGGSPTVVNVSFLDRSSYISCKQLFIYPHKGWVDPVPDPLLLRKSGSAGNRTRDL
jgi:hypothetical protein